jgi:hypothetical protein
VVGYVYAQKRNNNLSLAGGQMMMAVQMCEVVEIHDGAKIEPERIFFKKIKNKTPK